MSVPLPVLFIYSLHYIWCHEIISLINIVFCEEQNFGELSSVLYTVFIFHYVIFVFHENITTAICLILNKL